MIQQKNCEAHHKYSHSFIVEVEVQRLGDFPALILPMDEGCMYVIACYSLKCKLETFKLSHFSLGYLLKLLKVLTLILGYYLWGDMCFSMSPQGSPVGSLVNIFIYIL